MNKIIFVYTLLIAIVFSPQGLFAQDQNEYRDSFQEDIKNELHILREIIKDIQKNGSKSSSNASSFDHDQLMQQFEEKLEKRLSEFKIQLNDEQASANQSTKNNSGGIDINQKLYLLLGGTILLSSLISFVIAKSIAKSPNSTSSKEQA